MIPKRLIFIWIGKDVPEYGKHCMNVFSQVNPDFEIMFVHEPDLDNSHNQDILDLKMILNSGQKSIYTYMFERYYAQKHLQTEIGKITSFSDALRLYLLNKYGGIYLDLDTFPVKPFDDKILAYENGFVVNHDRAYCDFFFMGFSKGFVDNRMINLYPKSAKNLFNYKIHRLKMQEVLRTLFHKNLDEISKKFYNCNIKFGEHAYRVDCISEYYIDHFRRNTWRKQ